MSNDQRARILWTVVLSLAILGAIGVTSLCATLFFKNYADPAVLTAIIAITSGVVGSLSTLTIQKPTQGAASGDSITIDNPPNNPIPTKETP